MSRFIRRAAAVGAGLTAAAAVSLAAAPAASAYAPADEATIHPGVQTLTKGGQCTSNFIFTGAGRTYIGQSAHCASTGGQTDTDGCVAGSRPIGTPVEIDGASRPGRLAYSSWLAMQARGETDPSTCAYNDFALVEIDPADVASVNPSVPTYGGPTALRSAPTAAGDRVVSYGNSSLRQGITLLSPKQGFSLGTGGDGWTHPVYTVTPGVPGDSGSGFLDDQGQAFGTLSTLALAPLPASNGVGDLAKELAYANANGTQAALVEGTEPFDANALPSVG